MVGQILVIGVLDGLLIIALGEGHIFKLCGEGGVAAVVGPVCIQHTDLRHRRIPLLFVFIISLDMKEVLEGHSQI